MAFQKNEGHKPFIRENYVIPEIQYLAGKFYDIDDDNIEFPKLNRYAFDIETYSLKFPNPKLAEDTIVAITMYNLDTDKVDTFGLKEYTSGLNENLTYHYCESEKCLLETFFEFIRTVKPDVITG